MRLSELEGKSVSKVLITARGWDFDSITIRFTDGTYIVVTDGGYGTISIDVNKQPEQFIPLPVEWPKEKGESKRVQDS